MIWTGRSMFAPIPARRVAATPASLFPLAMMARSEAGTQMQLLSPFIMSLAERESAARRARFTCYWSVCDNIVFPASTATLPGADNRAVQGRPHVALAHAPIVLADVLTRTAPGGALGDAHADAACRSL